MDRGRAMKIPFGKYKGEFVDYLPDDYLRWLYFQDFLFAGIHAENNLPSNTKTKKGGDLK
jgi:hypothetical protein